MKHVYINICLIILIQLSILTSCNNKNENITSPQDTLKRYIDNVKIKKSTAVYDLLSNKLKILTTEHEIGMNFKQYSAEYNEQINQLNKLTANAIPVAINITLANGEEVTVGLEDGSWKIISGPADSINLNSPKNTIRVLKRALMRRDYFMILRLLSEERQIQLETEVEYIINGIKNEDLLPVQIEGNKAKIIYGPGHYLDLIRQEGEWRIENIR